jgi:hypothetical protein
LALHKNLRLRAVFLEQQKATFNGFRRILFLGGKNGIFKRLVTRGSGGARKKELTAASQPPIVATPWHLIVHVSAICI